MPTVRQKLHLSSCAHFRDRLCRRFHKLEGQFRRRPATISVLGATSRTFSGFSSVGSSTISTFANDAFDPDLPLKICVIAFESGHA